MSDNRLLNNPDYYKWCLCDKQGTCIGCIIDRIVEEALGEHGYSYMHTHMAQHGQMIIDVEEYEKAKIALEALTVISSLVSTGAHCSQIAEKALKDIQ